jgi:hypothetical protein
MATAVTFNGISYSIPAASETNWASLSLYLIALAQNAQTTNKQIMGVRTALTTPFSFDATTDFAVVSNLISAGPVAATLPTGVNGQMFAIIDGKGDAGTNNITISGTGGQLINGSASYVINTGRGAAIFQFSHTEGQWLLISSTGGSSGGGATFPVRTALTSPVTLVASDFCVMSNLSVAGAVAVNLPTGVDGMLFAIGDAKGDAASNNITITPASGNINGASTYVINRNKGFVLVQYNTTETQWKVIAEFVDAQSHISATSGVHGVSGNVVGTSDAQVITNKRMHLNTTVAANDSTSPRMVLPTNTYANLLTIVGANQPAAGALYWASDLLQEFVWNGTSLVATGSSASSSGEINTITNPSAASDTTGWTAGTSHTVTRDTSNSPLSPITSTCFDIAATTTAAESSTSGVYWTISTQPTGLRNKKLKVEFYFTTSASQTWNVGVYAGSTRMALSTDSSGATTIPAGTTGKFTTYFDADSSTAYTIHFTRTAGAGTTHLYMTSAINGPGTQPQGAVIGEGGQTYTPVLTASGGGSISTGTGGNAGSLGKWRRNGDTMEVVYAWGWGTSSTAFGTTGEYQLDLPTGYTVDTSKATSAAILGACGSGYYNDASTTTNYPLIVEARTTGKIIMRLATSATNAALGVTNPVTIANNDYFEVSFRVPIAEWAGAGTVNVAQNDVEFVSDDGSNDVFGPNGSLVPNQAAATGSSDRTFAFITPPQDSDLYVTELKDGANGTWNLAASQFPYSTGNNAGSTNQYGIQSFWASSTTYTVRFGNQGTKVDASNASAGTQSWATLFAAGWRFRVRKIKSGAAVGFGEVVPGLSSGLVSSSGLKGKTAGGSVATGYVGETVSQAITTIKTTVSADTFVDSSQTLTLDPGKWRIEYRGWMGLDWVSGTPRVQGALAIRTGSTTVETQAWRVTLTTSFPGLYMPANLIAEVDISVQTVYKMSVVCEQAAATATATLGNNASAFSGTNVVANSKMVATRIA